MAAIEEVKLIAQLAGPTRARHKQRDAVQFKFAVPVVFQVKDAVAKQGLKEIVPSLDIDRLVEEFAN